MDQLSTAKTLPSTFSIWGKYQRSIVEIKIAKYLLNAHLRIFYTLKISSYTVLQHYIIHVLMHGLS